MAVHNSQHNCNNSMDSVLQLRCLKIVSVRYKLHQTDPHLIAIRSRKDMGLFDERNKKNTYTTKVIIVITI